MTRQYTSCRKHSIQILTRETDISYPCKSLHAVFGSQIEENLLVL